MPATPNPIVNPAQGRLGTPLVQGMRQHGQQLRGLAAADQQGGIYDGAMNTVEISGPNINQVVTIGAKHLNGGVEVSTGFANGTAGRAKQENLATGTVTLTAGSTAATLDSTTLGTFADGQQIGAATASDTNAIQPGTTFTISGSSITLSQAALVSGTGLYCAACDWTAV